MLTFAKAGRNATLVSAVISCQCKSVKTNNVLGHVVFWKLIARMYADSLTAGFQHPILQIPVPPQVKGHQHYLQFVFTV